LPGIGIPSVITTLPVRSTSPSDTALKIEVVCRANPVGT
jgi:hypothetical protein